MDFRLKAFLAVAENLSFTKAAKELDVSQPAVSKHVQEIENTYKVKLFSRQGGRMELTTEGYALKKHAEEIVAAYSKMNMEMALLRKPVYGELRVGADTAAARLLYRGILSLFEERFHNVHLSVHVAQMKRLEEALNGGELDMVFVGGQGAAGMKVMKRDALPPQAEAFLEFVDLYK